MITILRYRVGLDHLQGAGSHMNPRTDGIRSGVEPPAKTPIGEATADLLMGSSTIFIKDELFNTVQSIIVAMSFLYNNLIKKSNI
jgi:hypothetical protein